MNLTKRINRATNYIETELDEYGNIMITAVMIFAEISTSVKNFIYATILVWLINGAMPLMFPHLTSLDFTGVLIIATLYTLWRNDCVVNSLVLRAIGNTKLSIISLFFALFILLFITTPLMLFVWNKLILTDMGITLSPMNPFIAVLIAIVGVIITSNRNDTDELE